MRRRARLAWVAVVAALALVSAPRVAAAEGHRIAVVIQLAVNVDDAAADAIGADLAASLTRVSGVPAIGGAAVRRQAGPVAEDCTATPACVAELAARLDVDQLVAALVVRVGDAVQLDVALLAPDTGVEVGRARIQIAAGDRLQERLDGISATLLPPTPTPAPPIPAPTVEPEPGPPALAPAPARHRHLTTASKVAGGVAAVALIGAAGFGWSARHQFFACQDRGDCDAGERDRIATHALVADVALGVGVAAVGVATWRYLGSRAAAPPADVTIRPSRGGAVVGVAGRF